MTKVHHTHIKMATEKGFIFEQAEGAETATLFWPERNVRITGIEPKRARVAIEEMEAAGFLLNYADKEEGIKITFEQTGPMQFHVYANGVPATERPGSISTVYGMMSKASTRQGWFADAWDAAEKGEFVEQDEQPGAFVAEEPEGEPEVIDEFPDSDDERRRSAGEDDEFVSDTESDPAEDDVGPEAIERVNGVATDGAIAYKEGTTAADCPFDNAKEDEAEQAEKWYEAWDAAADAAEPDADSDDKGGSVVSSKYRAVYAERGDPTTCGDALADYLNNICRNDKGTNLELFEAICELNGVDLSKYNRTAPGWQGRLRMTGRNLLARRVYANNSVLILPETLNEGKLQLPTEWTAAQRFKTKKA